MKKSMLFLMVAGILLMFTIHSCKDNNDDDSPKPPPNDTTTTDTVSCSDLFFSEYVEGSGQNKALEVYNPTNESINLSGYYVRRYKNGGTGYDTELPLVGTIASKGTFVITNGQIIPNQYSSIDSALYNLADMHGTGIYATSPMYFNGNDAVTLEKTTDSGYVIIDIFARIGPPDSEDGWTNFTDSLIHYTNEQGNPVTYTIQDYMVGPLYWLSWTQDHTLIRKPSVKTGVKINPSVFNPALQWDTLPKDTWTELRSHNCDCN